MEAVTTLKLKQDLQTVVADAEELLKATATQTGERIEKARVRLAQTSAALGQSARAAAHSVDDEAHKHPWATASIAAGVGLLLGLLIGRR